MKMKRLGSLMSVMLGFILLHLSAALAQQGLNGPLASVSLFSQVNIELGPKDGKELPPADLDRVKVGAVAPDFSLEDQNGNVVTLSSYRDKKAVVLVFYRGKW